MNAITQHYIIDLSSNNNFVQVPTVQGDGNGTRYIELELIENGIQYEISSNVKACIVGTKPDGTEILNNCTITNEGYILVEITSQMSAVPGRSDYQIMLIETTENKQLKSFPFIIIVTSATFDPSYITSTDEFTTLTETITKALADYTYVMENAQASADEAANSASNAKTFENSAQAYMIDASRSAGSAASSSASANTSATNASNSAKTAESWAIGGTNSRTGEDTNNAKYYSQQASTSASTASTKASEASTSASSAYTSATTASTKASEASTSASTASSKASEASTSAITASTKATEASSSAKLSESWAVGNTSTRSDENTNNSMYFSQQASSAANNASTSATTAQMMAEYASESLNGATTNANLSKSYAVGTNGSVRDGDATDNSKYYYEQTRDISQGLAGALLPMGTVTFAQLNNQTKQAGYMYNISDSFTTTTDFKEGAGHVIPAGSNVYWTADGKWDILAGSPVSGVKGDSESSYRTGNVNITKANIGLSNVENKSSATIRSELTSSNVTSALGYTPVSGVKGDNESSYRNGNVNITKSNIGLGNVENKSSATIRGELTKSNVTTALGYTPNRIIISEQQPTGTFVAGDVWLQPVT